jgi:hypothetical protein
VTGNASVPMTAAGLGLVGLMTFASDVGGPTKAIGNSQLRICLLIFSRS